MKYIKLKCSCGIQFLIALDDCYIKQYGEKVNTYYSCPDCEDVVYTDENTEIIELKEVGTNISPKI